MCFCKRNPPNISLIIIMDNTKRWKSSLTGNIISAFKALENRNILNSLDSLHRMNELLYILPCYEIKLGYS